MIIKNLIILDLKEEKANKFIFGDNANIICSDHVENGNKKGKSSLLKFIYYTLGVNIQGLSSDWNIKDIILKINYLHNGKDGFIIRYKHNNFFVSNIDKMIDEKVYGSWLMKLLGINLKLLHKEYDKEISIIPSAYIFPFYIDQESSWDGNVYKHLSDNSRYRDFPKKTMEYLLGFEDDSLIKLKSKLLEMKNLKKLSENQKTTLETLQDKFVVENSYETIFNENELKKEITQYLKLADQLSKKIVKYKTDIFNKRKEVDYFRIESNKLERIYEDNNTNYRTINACKCPTCDSELTIEQSIKRMNLKLSAFHIQDYINETTIAINSLNKEIDKYKSDQIIAQEEFDKLLNLSNTKNQELSLSQYIEEKANRYNKTNYNTILLEVTSNIQTKEKEIKEIQREISKINRQLEKYQDNIKEKFNNIKNNLQINLPISKISDSVEFLKFNKINKTGGGAVLNQTMLGLYLIYSVLLLEVKKIELPFGFDDIIKGSTDDSQTKSMYKQLDECLLSKECQSFVVMLSDKIQFLEKSKNINKIDLSNYDSLLNKENFDLLKEEIKFIYN